MTDVYENKQTFTVNNSICEDFMISATEVYDIAAQCWIPQMDPRTPT